MVLASHLHYLPLEIVGLSAGISPGFKIQFAGFPSSNFK